MRIGLQVPSFTFGSDATALGATLGEIARTAEQSGFASFWVMDHYFQIPLVGPAEQEVLEGYSTLAYCAALTERKCESYAKLGFEHAIFSLPNPDAIEPLETFGREVTPAVADL